MIFTLERAISELSITVVYVFNNAIRSSYANSRQCACKLTQYVEKEVICGVSTTKLQRSKSVKGTNLTVLKPEQSMNSLEQGVKVKTSKQIKTAKKARKSLECRQLENLRNLKLKDHEESLKNPENKASFLKAFNLEPQVIYL